MAWRRIELTAEEQDIVRDERLTHPVERVRRKLDVIWLLHHGQTQAEVREITGVSLKTIDRYITAFCEGGLEQLTRWKWKMPLAELTYVEGELREFFKNNPPGTIAEAQKMIFEKTGIQRGETVVRNFLKNLGMNWRRTTAIPVPPKKS